MVALMTGVPTIGMIGQQDHCAGGPSIDQLLLQKSSGLGGPSFSEPHAVRVVAAGGRRSFGSGRGGSARAFVPGPEERRRAIPAWPASRSIRRLRRSTSSTGSSAAPCRRERAHAQILAQKTSVITYLQSDLARLQTLVPASEKDRLTAHADAIAHLEASIQQMYGSMTQNSVCTKPATPPSYANTSSGVQGSGSVYSDLGGVDYYVPNQPTSHPHLDLGQTQLRLIKAAFACDLVRVATFMWSAGTNWVVFPGTFQGATIAGSPQSTPHHPPEPQRSVRRSEHPGLAESDQSVLLQRDLHGSAGVRHDSRHRRQHADRQHRDRVPHRGRARLGSQPAEHAAHRSSVGRTPASRAARS